jgi:Essential protein Yae1, N terminal
MLRDDEAFPMAARTYTVDIDELAGEETIQHEAAYPNDDFDDVFGSAPPSPTSESPSGGNLELSDVPRLEQKHETEGYRDGVTKGKAETVQAGFDEGYGLGAVLGLRIGKVLGLLEGIWRAVRAGEDGERLEGFLGEAKKELKTESVFGREWWGEDGIWTFEVPGEGLEGREVTFPDVAGAHPLIVKWEQIIEAEVKRWGLDLGLIETEHRHEEKGEHMGVKDATEVPRLPGAQKAEFSW